VGCKRRQAARETGFVAVTPKWEEKLKGGGGVKNRTMAAWDRGSQKKNPINEGETRVIQGESRQEREKGTFWMRGKKRQLGNARR